MIIHMHDPCFILQSLYFILFSSKTLKLKCFESTFKIFLCSSSFSYLFHIFSIYFSYIFHKISYLFVSYNFFYIFFKKLYIFFISFPFIFTPLFISFYPPSPQPHPSLISFLSSPLFLPHLSSFSSPLSP